MSPLMQDLMREATRLTQRGDLAQATALIQRALSGSTQGSARPVPADAEVIEAEVREVPEPSAEPTAEAGPLRGRFLHGRLARDWRLVLPPRPEGAPLLVMLHGCTQDADDFAAGTRMDELARAQGFAVLYPEQSQDANPQRCWNWFKHHHQQRGRGEAGLIAALAQQVVRAHDLDARRVFVAGLSAGGAMAGLLGAAYPDVYAAVGIHSGLPPGVAASLPEALAAMRGNTGPAARPLPLPTIVFHGDADRTVAVVNAERTVAAALAGRDGTSQTEAHGDHVRTRHLDRAGRVIAEQWIVRGGGHTWFGGSPAGSHTARRGPDASAEMLRFFAAAQPITPASRSDEMSPSE